MHAIQPTTTTRSPFASGARLVAADGRELPLRHIALDVDARAGLAAVVLEQRFANPFAEPLVVSYSVPLPHDAAVAGFAFRIGGRRVVGEIDRRETARERYLEALMEGRGAALLEQERGSLFTQEVGNIPPGEEVVVEVTLDQPLAWLAGGAWEWRFPLVVAPRYLGAAGRVPDAGRVFQDVVTDDDGGPDLRLRAVLRDRLAADARVSSPSHAIVVRPDGSGLRVDLDDVAERPVDRDLVLRWPVAGAAPSSVLDPARPPAGHAHAGHAFALLTLTPPAPAHASPPLPLELVLLVDTSGSMHGAPLALAKAVAARLVGGLGAGDTLSMIAFGSQPRHWRSAPVAALPEARAAALDWIDALAAEGGTEMVDGVLAALAGEARDAPRQVVLISDGLVGFEGEVVAAIRRTLAHGTRLHSIGIGAASNRSLTAACARAGRGSELLIGDDDDVAAAATRVAARLAAPIVTALELAGDALVDTVPAALPDLHAGCPVRIGVRLRAAGGTLRVRGRMADGAFETEVAVPSLAPGEGRAAVMRLYARETVEDLEMELAAGAERAVIDSAVEQAGLDFAIATRLTSWVAVAEEPAVDPREPIRRVRQPQRLPAGLSAEGLGLTASPPTVMASYSMDLSEDVEDLSLNYDRGHVSMRIPDLEVYRSSRARHSARSEPPPFRPWRDLTYRRQPRPGLVARLVRRERDRLVFEVDIDRAPLEWQLPDEVELVWGDGTREVVLLVPALSTRAGSVEEGATLRLVVRRAMESLAAGADTPEQDGVAGDPGQPAPVALLLRSLLYGTRRIRVEAADVGP